LSYHALYDFSGDPMKPRYEIVGGRSPLIAPLLHTQDIYLDVGAMEHILNACLSI